MITTCQGILFSGRHSHPFGGSFMWHFLASQRRNKNIWLELGDWQQGPTFRKLQLEDFFPLYFHFVKLFNLKNVCEYAICFFYIMRHFFSQCHWTTLKQFSVACCFGSHRTVAWCISSNFSSLELKRGPMSQNKASDASLLANGEGSQIPDILLSRVCTKF